ncbi:peptidoglycan-binding protein [Microbacterium horticulturae]|uniref:Peptidoglycan-binding protein n=1 Tax=Microbacterium horticulturae TaxID=3028316 RepID=A0ABY8C061_9MICO|nr:peptidoglycan-binding protein [Microbacterium sp. KACC 23027]WEG09839.1 peptidoglycan-binding protein [Microbacterium sp. KACC 23027]
MSRVVAIGAAAVGAIALVAGGWFAAAAFTSPAQRAAAAAAPEEQPIVAEVSRGDLIEQRTLPGQVQPQAASTVSLVAVPDAPRSVVTASPLRVDATVKAGDVVVRINGSPVFALASPFAFYRDLGVGDHGPDVTQLQKALVGAGYLSTVDGRFGAATARAVAALYAAHGDVAPTRDDPASTTAPAVDADADDAPPVVAHASPYLPYAAVAALPSLPARVASTPAVGADAASAQITVSSASLVARVSVTDDARDAVTRGARVDCAIGGTDITRCRVAAVADEKSADTGGAAGDAATDITTRSADLVPADGSAIPQTAADVPATAVVTVRTIATDALLLPATAVADRGGSAGAVLRRGDDGAFHEVRVTVIGATGGEVAVRGDLDAGDTVRVG